MKSTGTGSCDHERARSHSRHVPALILATGARVQTLFWEFFVSNIRNPHPRRAYGRSIAEPLAWCEQHGLASIIDVELLHLGAYIEAVTRSQSASKAKQKLAAIRRLFDWLVTGQIMSTNQAASVRGPRHVRHRQTHPQPAAPGQCPCNDPAARLGSRYCYQDRQSLVPRDRHHRLSRERWDA